MAWMSWVYAHVLLLAQQELTVIASFCQGREELSSAPVSAQRVDHASGGLPRGGYFNINWHGNTGSGWRLGTEKPPCELGSCPSKHEWCWPLRPDPQGKEVQSNAHA